MLLCTLQNALLSAVPYLGMWIFSILVSIVGDKLLQANLLTIESFRKIANSIGKCAYTILLS